VDVYGPGRRAAALPDPCSARTTAGPAPYIAAWLYSVPGLRCNPSGQNHIHLHNLLRVGRAITLTHALRKLHKALIDVETQYFGAIASPLEHLQLITAHPHFAWLQKLSSLMAELDERLDEKDRPFDQASAADFRIAIEALIGPARRSMRSSAANITRCCTMAPRW
jgi:hypothetical protein